MMSKILIGFIRIYQIFFSGFTGKCLYKPSCSTYAILAIKKYGIVKGVKMTMNRINRCDAAHIHLYDTEDYP
jgi:putative membrane protein insertion efficiency factor